MVGVLLDDLSGCTEQVRIGPCGRYSVPNICRALDHLIDLPLIVHPIQCIVSVAQHLCGLIRPPDTKLQAIFPKGQRCHDQKGNPKHQKQRPQDTLQSTQDLAVRHGYDGIPAVVHPGVINTPALAVQIPDDRVSPKASGLDFFNQAGQIALHFLPVQVQASLLIDDRPGAVTEEEGVIFREIRRVEAQMLRENVKRHHSFPVAAALCSCDHRPVIDCICIDRCEHDRPFRIDSLLVPGRSGIIISRISLPGVSRQNLSIQYHIGVNHAGTQHRVYPLKICVQKHSDALLPFPILQAAFQGRCAER